MHPFIFKLNSIKKIFTLVVSLLIFNILQAQNPVPNSSFESWIDANNPTGWSYSSDLATITKVTGFSPLWAAQGTVVSATPNNIKPVLATDISGGGFAVSGFYQYLQFYYNTALTSGGGGQDRIQIEVHYYDNSSNNAGYALGTQKFVSTPTSNWTLKQVQIVPTAYTPTKATIQFSIEPQGADPAPHVGSWFIIDSVKLTNSPIGIDEIEESAKLQVFPNPVIDYLTIKTESNKPMQIKLSDALGRVVLQRASLAPVNGIIQDTIHVESLS